MIVGVIGTIPDVHARHLAESRPDLRLVPATDSARMDAVLAWDLDVPELEAVLARQPDLPWLHLRWAGVPDRLIASLRGHPTRLTNGSGAFGAAIAEYVAAVVLAFYKRLPEFQSAQARAAWLEGVWLRELRGQQVGIIGLGDVGGSIARVLRAFGVRLRGLRRTGAPSAEVDEVFGLDDRARFFDGLDILVVAAPLTPATRGLVGAPEIERLAPDALLVNVGRAAIVREDALLAALEGGRLGGAALDVFWEEPLPPASPLWRLPNVSITPHCCDHTPRSDERAVAIILENLARFEAGQAPRNLVNLTEGY